MSNKSFSANYPETNMTIYDRVVALEKILNLLITMKGTHHDDPNYGSSLYEYIDLFFDEDMIPSIKTSLTNDILTYLPEYKERVDFSINPLDTNDGFTIRIIYEDSYITLDSRTLKE